MTVAASPTVSVVVPVLDCAETLEELAARIAAAMGRRRFEWELILVNDGSSDESWAKIVSLGAGDRRIRGIDLTRNFGQHHALLAGVNASRHEVIVTLDGDLQNPPEEIPALLGALEDGADVVYGVPIESHHPLPRRLLGKAARRLVQMLTVRRDRVRATGFRAFRARLCAGLDELQGARVSLDALLSWSSRNFASVPVRHSPRRAGRSSYTPRRLVRHAVAELSASVLPPRVRAGKPSYAIRALTPATDASDAEAR